MSMNYFIHSKDKCDSFTVIVVQFWHGPFWYEQYAIVDNIWSSWFLHSMWIKSAKNVPFILNCIHHIKSNMWRKWNIPETPIHLADYVLLNLRVWNSNVACAASIINQFFEIIVNIVVIKPVTIIIEIYSINFEQNLKLKIIDSSTNKVIIFFLTKCHHLFTNKTLNNSPQSHFNFSGTSIIEAHNLWFQNQ